MRRFFFSLAYFLRHFLAYFVVLNLKKKEKLYSAAFLRSRIRLLGDSLKRKAPVFNHSRLKVRYKNFRTKRKKLHTLRVRRTFSKLFAPFFERHILKKRPFKRRYWVAFRRVKRVLKKKNRNLKKKVKSKNWRRLWKLYKEEAEQRFLRKQSNMYSLSFDFKKENAFFKLKKKKFLKLKKKWKKKEKKLKKVGKKIPKKLFWNRVFEKKISTQKDELFLHALSKRVSFTSAFTTKYRFFKAFVNRQFIWRRFLKIYKIFKERRTSLILLNLHKFKFLQASGKKKLGFFKLFREKLMKRVKERFIRFGWKEKTLFDLTKNGSSSVGTILKKQKKKN